MNFAVRISLPILLRDGSYYWCLCSVYPLQFNKLNNITTEIHIFQVLHKYSDEGYIKFDIWENSTVNEFLTHQLKTMVNSHNCLKVSKRQKQILEIIYKNPKVTNLEIAEKIGNKKATVDVLCKQILVKARKQYNGFTIKSIRELVEIVELVQ